MRNSIAVFIIGPTGIGKTSLSLKLHNIFDVEIINIDSVMIYKNMNIGSGKPDEKNLKKINHNLTNIFNIKENYSVFKFCIDIIFLIKKSIFKKKIPLLIGGNIMYIWFFQNYFLSKYFAESKEKIINFLNIVIIPINNEKIKKYIKKRFFYMLKNSIIEEVKNIYNNKKISLKNKSINSIGYKDIWLYLDNKSNFKEIKKSIINSTIELSKRQRTWFKKWCKKLYYFESKNKNIIYNILNLIKKNT